MTNYTRDEVKAGLMVVISGFILVVFIFFISGLNLGKKTKIYAVKLKHTGGVVVGSLVRYGGMEVGKITEVQISEPDNTYLEMKIEVDDKTPIKVDSKAFLSALGLLGDYYIEISPGTINAPDLPPGSHIPSQETTQFTQLTEPFEDMSAKLQNLIDRINDLLNDNSREHVSSMIASMDSILVGNIGNINGIMYNLKETTANFQRISHQLDQMLNNENIQIEETWKTLNRTIEEVQLLTQELQKTTGNLNQMVVSSDQNLTTILNDLEQTTRNLNQFSQQIKEQPWSLIRKSSPKPRELP
ncbi:MCE family protein [candidate division KSB1 bacterium]|nr:MCE family protein [candidate division KSB1 bacterium]